MASKIITLRLPRSTYDTLASAAAVAGLPLSVYVRNKIDRAEITAAIDLLIAEVQAANSTQRIQPPNREREILLLVRTMAAQINPQIPSAVAAKLREEAKASGGKQ